MGRAAGRAGRPRATAPTVVTLPAPSGDAPGAPRRGQAGSAAAVAPVAVARAPGIVATLPRPMSGNRLGDASYAAPDHPPGAGYHRGVRYESPAEFPCPVARAPEMVGEWRTSSLVATARPAPAASRTSSGRASPTTSSRSG